jgi:FAD/FMN-containing dehydrogenase
MAYQLTSWEGANVVARNIRNTMSSIPTNNARAQSRRNRPRSIVLESLFGSDGMCGVAPQRRADAAVSSASSHQLPFRSVVLVWLAGRDEESVRKSLQQVGQAARSHF